MIETIYKVEDSDNKKPDISIRLPKNIKQIGQSDVDMSCQIYIEENVLTYIKQKPYKEKQVRYGVLLGDKKQGNGYTYIFINGMVEVEEVIEDSIIFSDDVWTGIYDNIRRYYKEGVIVGWYASFDYDVTKDMLGIRKIHLDHFAGNNKVFMNINREDDDESFYIYERNSLRKQPCYHVYFEKSDEFEDYIFGSGRKDSAIKEKETAAKETGKYGIALNNSNKVTSANGGVLGKISKEGEKLSTSNFGKVASFLTIIALAGAIAMMGLNGGFDGLQGKVRGFVDGILNSEDNKPEEGNIIEVDGNPTQQGTSGDNEQTLPANAEQTSSTAENISENVSENTSENASSGEGESSAGEANAGVEEETTTSKLSEENSTDNTDEGADNEFSNESDSKSDNQSDTQLDNQEETTENAQASVTGTDDIRASYTVKSGETLYSISMSFYGSPDKIGEIMELNDITDENYVMEGQKILLP